MENPSESVSHATGPIGVVRLMSDVRMQDAKWQELRGTSRSPIRLILTCGRKLEYLQKTYTDNPKIQKAHESQ